MIEKTKTKMNILASEIWCKWGSEWKYLAHPKAEYNKISMVSRAGGKVSYQTLSDNMSYLDKKLKSIEAVDFVDSVFQPEPLDMSALITAEKEIDKMNVSLTGDYKNPIDYVITFYKDGTFIKEIPISEEPIIEETKRVYVGLFDYGDGDVAILRKGKYKGCNIKIPTDIFKHFGNVDMFEGWCHYQKNLANKPGFKGRNADTEENIETLNKAIDNISKKLRKIQNNYQN